MPVGRGAGPYWAVPGLWAASELLPSSEWGLSRAAGPNPAQSQGVKRFRSCWHPFFAPSLEKSKWQRWSEAESPARGWRHPLSISLPVKLNWSLPVLLKIVILDKRLCNNLRTVGEDLVLILYKPSLTSGSLKSNLAELTRAVNVEPLDSRNWENRLTNLQYFGFFTMLSEFLKVFTSLWICVKKYIFNFTYMLKISGSCSMQIFFPISLGILNEESITLQFVFSGFQVF